jgi:hypothetical protein
MANEWYLRKKDGSEHGPITMEALRDLRDRGKISRSTPLRQGEGIWRTAGECRGLFDEPEEEPVDYVAKMLKAAPTVGAKVLQGTGRAFAATGRGLKAIAPKRIPKTELVTKEREPAVLMPRPAPVQQAVPQPAPQTVVVVNNVVHAPQQRQSQALPALVSLIFPPWGQLIQGRFFAFLAWYVFLIAAAASILVGIGIILFPLCWLLCVLDAAMYKPRN